MPSFGWTYIDPVMRTAINTFKSLTPEQRATLRSEMHLLFYHLEDLQQIVETMDENRRSWEQQRAHAERVLHEDSDPAVSAALE